MEELTLAVNKNKIMKIAEYLFLILCVMFLVRIIFFYSEEYFTFMFGIVLFLIFKTMREKDDVNVVASLAVAFGLWIFSQGYVFIPSFLSLTLWIERFGSLGAFCYIFVPLLLTVTLIVGGVRTLIGKKWSYNFLKCCFVAQLIMVVWEYFL